MNIIKVFTFFVFSSVLFLIAAFYPSDSFGEDALLARGRGGHGGFHGSHEHFQGHGDRDLRRSPHEEHRLGPTDARHTQPHRAPENRYHHDTAQPVPVPEEEPTYVVPYDSDGNGSQDQEQNQNQDQDQDSTQGDQFFYQ